MNLNTNLVSLLVQNKHQQSTSKLTTAIERLSSGLRINSAKDDAGGQAVASRMDMNINVNKQINRGVNDGISLTQTAEGGLNEINNLLQRSRELTVQAATGTLSQADRDSIHQEFAELRDEIDRIAAQTEIFGKYPLAPLRDNPPKPPTLGETPPTTEIFPEKGQWEDFSSGIVSLAYIPEGATDIILSMDSFGMNDDIQIFTTSGKHLVGSPAGAGSVWGQNGINDINDIFTVENGFKADAQYDDTDLLTGDKTQGPYNSDIGGMKIEYSGDGNPIDNVETVTISEVMAEENEGLILLVVGKGAFRAKMEWDHMPELEMQAVPPTRPPHSYPIEIITNATMGNEVESVIIDATPSDSKSLGIDEVSLETAETAQLAFAKLDQALETVNSYRAHYGSVNNRFDTVTENLATTTTNLEASRSRIQDADYAEEVSNMTREQILQQVSTSIMAQANQLPKMALSILEN